MLKRYGQGWLAVVVLCDLAVAAGCWLLAYAFRFHAGVIPAPLGIQSFHLYARALPAVLVAAGLCYRGARLYVPRREGAFLRELADIFRANVYLLVVGMALMFFTRPLPSQPDMGWSRPVALVFAAINFPALALERAMLRGVLRRLRRAGKNLRHVVIVGCGRLGQEVQERIERNPWTGFRLAGFVDPTGDMRPGQSVRGAPVLGSIEDIPRIERERGVEQIFVALPFGEQHRLAQVANATAGGLAHLRVFPDLRSFVTLNPTVEDFDGLPVLSLHETPLAGANVVLKRGVDLALGGAALLLATPVIMAFGLAHRMTSPGPIFYRQRRVGLDGREFDIVKLRSMRVDAEREQGPRFAVANDPRCTPLGAFMRRWNIDELPQLWNVVKGEMSLVGPRPERPEFIEEFRRSVPKYMLRHKMKAGMTGWAQVNGWRGDTSIEKRIQYDLYYIEHWSLLFDLWILILTPFARQNAY